MDYVWIVFCVIAAITVFWVVATYNRLIAARNECENSWTQIDVQLKRRYDLIPNLVETAKGYMAHEKETLEGVIKARQIAIDAATVKDQAAAENFLTSTLRSLMAVTENYPDLKADAHMASLQEEISSTENRIGFARQHYNDTVMRYNNFIQMVPASAVAKQYKFDKRDYFELTEEAQREPIKVAF